MTRFIPKEKLGRRARKELDSRKRLTWSISPVTRTIDSRKRYNRKRSSRDFLKDWKCGSVFCISLE